MPRITIPNSRTVLLWLCGAALTFNSQSECQSWLTLFESRWTHSPEWHYAFPSPLKDGRFYVPIIPSAMPKLTEAEKASMVDLSESDLPDPPPMPE